MSYYTKLAAFKQFPADNPDVWNRFCDMADDLRKKGYRHYSHDTLISVIRFQYDIVTNGEPFKIANEMKAFYGRAYVLSRKCKGFFHFCQMEGEPTEQFEKYRELH